MADQYESVCSAITAFGGDSDPARWYWTSTTYESDSSRAWCFILSNGSVGHGHWSASGCVRAVCAI